MIIFNITFNTDAPIVAEWKQWLKATYIPMHYQTTLISGHLFSEVQVQEELGGTTYSLQFFFPNDINYQRFLKNHAPNIDETIHQKFGNQYVFFKTTMRQISYQYPKDEE
jgi:hypothetical protein